MPAAEAYLGLARKYRPQRFEDLVGQEAVAQALMQALRQNKVVHGHLFAGPRGTGKTTTARILARALNCAQGASPTPCGECRHCIDIAAGSDMDVIEIDGASNNGVDNIRELREQINLAPFSARHKVYIIDEVHMLSAGAFNALLKTLEEPPSGVVFVFATTELEKVPETIRSRCVLHQLRRLTTDDIVRRLTQVAQAEEVALEAEAAREVFGLIARAVDGGMRDALVILDQLLALTDRQPTAEATVKLLGLADPGSLADTVDWLVEGKPVELLKLIEDLVGRGRSLERFVKELTAYLRNLMLLQAHVGDDMTSLTGEPLARAKAQAQAVAPAPLYNIINQILELEEKLKQSTQARFLVEFAFLRLARVKPIVSIDQIMNRIQALPDDTLGGGPGKRAAEPAAAMPQPAAQPLRREEAAPVAPRPAAFAVMNDSAPATPAPTTSAVAPSSASVPVPLAGLAHGELVRLVQTNLPDNVDFLKRYFAETVDIRIDGGMFTLVWPAGKSLNRRVMEKPDNTRAAEAVLTQLAGRPMKLAYAEAAVAAKPTAASTAKAPSRQPVMADSFGEGDDAPVDASESFHTAMPVSPAAQASPADTRSAMERAQAFLNLNDEASRRLKLIQGMLNGRVIDEQGQPLAI